MKIEINNKPPREFYDELYYMTVNYKKLLLNPKMKVKKMITSVIQYFFISLIGLIFSLVVYFTHNKDSVLLVAIVIFSICLFITIIGYILINRNINTMLTDKVKSVIEIDKKSISLTKKNTKTSITWDTVNKVVINKYSIMFLPLNNTIPFIALSTEYTKEILDALKKLKKEELLQDNSELYK